jgi:AraC family transcriptional regulator, melibiose operon regulatory protein
MSDLKSIATVGRDYVDESVPVHPGHSKGYPVVVFGENRFCAGQSQRVQVMPGPHMHSQVELNFVLTGHMTYWHDSRIVSLSEGRLAMFWGMIPHQVIEHMEGTKFVVLYVPMSVFLELSSLSRLRDAIFRGAFIEALDVRSYDRDLFQCWQTDLLGGDPQLELIVRDELATRIRRLDKMGWQDLRHVGAVSKPVGSQGHDHDRAIKVESMSRYIVEHANDDIGVAEVAKAVGLHPNYAMSLFKQTLGVTIVQSIGRHRLDTAQSMLIATNTPVSRIAYDCGFGSISSFYAAFQKRFAVSPLAYRQKIRPPTP